MQTVVDVDETLLGLAERQARCEGKTLGAFVEEALRSVLHPAQLQPCDDADVPDEPGLSADDPFFRALDEVRALGRLPAAHRQLGLE